MALGKGGLCRVPRIRHSVKRVLNFFKKFPLCRVPSQGTRQRHLKKIQIFAECRAGATRQSIFFQKNEDIFKKKSLSSAMPGALGKVLKFFFAKCQIWDTRQRNLKKNKSLPSARSGTLGKEFF